MENYEPLEIVGKGIEKSRLVLDAGERGLVMNGGKLTVKNCTVSCYTSEGLTMLGGDVMLENCQINGSRHGIYVSEGRLEADGLTSPCAISLDVEGPGGRGVIHR